MISAIQIQILSDVNTPSNYHLFSIFNKTEGHHVLQPCVKNINMSQNFDAGTHYNF